jgi:tRNA(fMet)-specific endonuclease VapC
VECELLFGMRRRTSPRWQQQYEIAMRGIEVLSMEANVSMVHTNLRTQLEAAGSSIGANDTLIAAHAIALGATLVSGDAKFNRVPGLMIENWLQPL